MTAFSNPGIPTKEYHLTKAIYEDIKKQYKQDDSINMDYKICFQCNVFTKKENEIGHCVECNICIVGYDHHCMWSSKCIGKGNLCYFYLFLVGFSIMLVYGIFSIVYVNIL